MPLAGPTLPTIGTFSYNGFTFPNAINTKIVTEPVYDFANRTRKYVKTTITTEFILTSRYYVNSGNTTADDQMETIRALLLAPGKELRFTDKGFGDEVIINSGSTSNYIDVDYGPKPEVLVWEALVEAQSARVVWQCSTKYIPCGTLINQDGALEYTYSISWTISDTGATQRIIKGKIEVLAYLLPNNSLSDYADKYRVTDIPSLPGFHREQEYSMSEDQRYLNFVIVDTEIESDNPFQPFMVRSEADHSANSSLIGGGSLEQGGAAFKKWACEISGNYTVAPKAPRALAWVAFLTLVKSRFDKAPVGSYQQYGDDFSARSRKARRMILSISIRESVYSRELSFSVRYVLWTPLKDFFKNSGILEIVPGTWAEWTQSMQENVHHIRGNAKLQSLPGVVHDRCDSTGANQQQTEPNLSVQHQEPDFNTVLSDNPTPPAAGDSWLEYDNDFEVQEITNTAVHRRQVSGPDDLARDLNLQPNPDAIGFILHGKEQSGTLPQDSAIITQTRGYSTYRIRMKGYAVRQGHKIPMPTLTSFGGQPVIRLPGSKWSHKQVGKGTVPIFRAAWVQEYIAENVITGDLTASMETSGIPAAYR